MHGPSDPHLRRVRAQPLSLLAGLACAVGLALLLASCGSPMQSGGELHFAGQRYDRSAEAFEAEVARDPANARAWVWLGRSYAELDSVGRALHAFERAVAVDSGLAVL